MKANDKITRIAIIFSVMKNMKVVNGIVCHMILYLLGENLSKNKVDVKYGKVEISLVAFPITESSLIRLWYNEFWSNDFFFT